MKDAIDLLNKELNDSINFRKSKEYVENDVFKKSRLRKETSYQKAIKILKGILK